MAAEAEAYCGIAVAARMRRLRQLLTRIVIGCLIASVAERPAGLGDGDAVAVGVPRRASFRRCSPLVLLTLRQVRIACCCWRNVLGCIGVLLNGAAFGALSIPLWNLEGMAGGVIAALIISAAMLNAVVGTPGSRIVLACALGTGGRLPSRHALLRRGLSALSRRSCRA